MGDWGACDPENPRNRRTRAAALVERISENGTTILLVEQNAMAAMDIADSCYVIDQGAIVFGGTADELRGDEETRDRYLGV